MMSRKKKKEKEEPEIVEASAEDLDRIDEPETDWQDKYLRTLAELDNFRKRTEREREQVRRYALEGFLRQLLPVLDALGLAADAAGGAKAIRKGLKMALSDLRRLLGDHGVEEIEALEQPFDPRWHEAVGMVPADENPPGMVVKEERIGYRLGDRVLRASRVHITVALPEAPAADEDSED